MSNKIINFHDVRDINWFEKTILILKNKYKLISIEDLDNFFYNGKELNNCCHITIDDGDKTFYDIIYPVLKKHKIPATLYVSSKICTNSENFWFQEMRGFNELNIKEIIAIHYNIDIKTIVPYSSGSILKNCRIDDIINIIKQYKMQFGVDSKAPQNMTNEQLKEIDKDGLVVIGAHTLNHPILKNETAERSKVEIVDSINELAEILNHEIKYFAYPNGIPFLDFDEREFEYLKSKNIRLAFSTESNNFSKGNNPLSIPRFGISFGNHYFVKTKLLLGKNWDLIKNLKSKGEKQTRLEINKELKLE